MNKRELTLVVEFDADKQPDWIWDSHLDGKDCNGFYVKAICEGNALKETFEESVEWGNCSDVKFAECKAYDAKGNEIDMRCPTCKNGMTQLIGKTAFQNICTFCEA